MQIGELARATGLSRSRIRFYEARGILPPPTRRDNGYRDYPPATVAALTFIDRGQAMGFTLAELSAAITASPNDLPAGVELLDGLRRKHAELRQLIKEASAKRRQVGALIEELARCVPASAERVE
ncbi:MerR family DNA-binding transcriptional regulator [Sphingomonas sp. QA11]|uniref:MerR family transcriptional regulator n=1 Tax=Sphingomonas sp. QA11 TaxID=2950605 RepID=UPI002348F112|nr:MerR family transcriptional regulator [Sphingomonas sp. QA11]WCM29096.1 MerR family DNA-binding transcriptional regulator [Sphingomonas sp. QA11]